MNGRPAIYALPCLAILAGCAVRTISGNAGWGNSVKGSGVVGTETRIVPNFHRIEVSAAIILDATQGPLKPVTISADKNLLPLILTKVENGVLIIGPEGSMSTNNPMRVTVSAPLIDGLHGTGATKTTLRAVNAPKFALELSGASQADIRGVTKDLAAILSGAANLNWANLALDRVKVELSGGSSADIRGSSKTLDLKLSGGSSADLKGLSVETARVDASGGAQASLKVSGSLTADASGASSINYSGNPGEVKKSASGASTISPG